MSAKRVVWILCLLLALTHGNFFCAATQQIRRVRTIGGDYANIGQFPHQVALLLRGRNYCGGSLISTNWILTAAHCTIGVDPKRMKALVGAKDLGTGVGDKIGVAQFIMHPLYRPEVLDYDIALVRLSFPVQFSDRVQKIQLADACSEFPANKTGTVSGFGLVNQGHERRRALIYADVPIWDPERCKRLAQAYSERMLCAAHQSGQPGSCQGDSGGPLTVDGKLYGIVSFGTDCGSPGLPVVYAYVPAYRSWISQNVCL